MHFVTYQEIGGSFQLTIINVSIDGRQTCILSPHRLFLHQLRPNRIRTSAPPTSDSVSCVLFFYIVNYARCHLALSLYGFLYCPTAPFPPFLLFALFFVIPFSHTKWLSGTSWRKAHVVIVRSLASKEAISSSAAFPHCPPALCEPHLSKLPHHHPSRSLLLRLFMSSLCQFYVYVCLSLSHVCFISVFSLSYVRLVFIYTCLYSRSSRFFGRKSPFFTPNNIFYERYLHISFIFTTFAPVFI